MRFERWYISKSGISNGWVLLFLALIAMSVYLMKNRPEMINKYIPGLLATPTPNPTPAVTSVAVAMPEPTPEATPVAVPKPTCETSPTPSASATPNPEVFNISAMTSSELPKTVRVLSDETFIIAGGKGSTVARAGTLVSVASRSGEMLTISYLGGLKQIAYTKTSLESDVQSGKNTNNETLPLTTGQISIAATPQPSLVPSDPPQSKRIPTETRQLDISQPISATELAKYADEDKALASKYLTDKKIKVFGSIEKATVENISSSSDNQIIITLATEKGLPRIKIRLSPSMARSPSVFRSYNYIPSWWSHYSSGKVEFRQNSLSSVQVRTSYKHSSTSVSSSSTSQYSHTYTDKHSTEWSSIFSPGDPMTVEGVFKGIGVDVEIGGGYMIDPQNSGINTPAPYPIP